MSFSERKKGFRCPEESTFYTKLLSNAIFPKFQNSTIAEFGSGDGMPVINAIENGQFKGLVLGYEPNKYDYRQAQMNIKKHNVANFYRVHCNSFFSDIERIKCLSKVLISNPPYVPASNKAKIPRYVYGGPDGGVITRNLLSLDFHDVMILLSSISNPIKTLLFAKQCGYCLAGYILTELPFGFYTTEPIVQATIQEMKEKGTAFCSMSSYRLVGAHFTKSPSDKDFYNDLLRKITKI